MAQLQWRSDDTIKWKEGFGKGLLSSYAVPANEGCSGTSGTKTLTLAAAGGFANNDLILIHQTRGTGAGAWQLNKIVSGAGTTTLTLKYDLTNTYTDSGDNQAQVIELNQYKDLTTGSITAPAWDGSKGGIIAFLDKGTCTISGTLSVNGNAGGLNTVNSGIGFSGGVGNYNRGQANNGESYLGAGSASSSANGTAGGGGSGDDYSGGGGGHATSGIIGQTGGGCGGTRGAAGGTVGVADLTTMFFGGAGGGGAEYDTSRKLSGAGGGGIVLIISKTITISGNIYSNGGTALSSESYGHGAGSGAGGSVLLKCETATLGTTKITATGGTNIMQRNIEGTLSYGGGGGVGRIHLDYSGSYTGTTSPTLDARQDLTIKPKKLGGGLLYANFL